MNIKQIIYEEIQSLNGDGLSDNIDFVKRGKIKVGLHTEKTDDRAYVIPDIEIEDSYVNPKTIDSSKYTYRYRITFVDTTGKELKFSDYIRQVANGNYLCRTGFSFKGKFNKQGLRESKLKEISTDILSFNKTDEKTPVNITNIDKYEFKNHDDEGYIKLDDNVQRVYKNNVAKTKDDASYNKGGKQVFRRGGKDLNKVDDDYFNGWEEKHIQVGKYKGTKYGELINKDKRYFDWLLQNTKYYEPSDTRYDIPTNFNTNLYNYLKNNGIL